MGLATKIRRSRNHVPRHLPTVRRGRSAAVLAMLMTVGLATGASASTGLNLPEPYGKFDYCPAFNPELRKCLYSFTKSGSVTLGKKTVPIVNPATLTGGYGRQAGEQVIDGHYWERVAQFYGPTNELTLSKPPSRSPAGCSASFLPHPRPRPSGSSRSSTANTMLPVSTPRSKSPDRRAKCSSANGIFWRKHRPRCCTCRSSSTLKTRSSAAPAISGPTARRSSGI